MCLPLSLLAVAALAISLVGCAAADDDTGSGQDADHQISVPSPTAERPSPRPEIGTWTELAELPAGRSEIGAEALDGMIYVAGGFAQDGQADRFLRYDPAADTWTELAPSPVQPHHAHLGAYDGIVYLVGGCAPVGEPHMCRAQDTLFAYDVATDTWQEGPPMPVPVGAHAVATTDDGVIHVIGGLVVGDRGFPDSSTVHQAFDIATGAWSTLPEPELAREHHAAAYLDGVVYVAGGRRGPAGNELEAYDVETQEWTRLADAPTSRRSGIAVVAFEGQIYVFGGEETIEKFTFDHAERYDPATDTWEEVSPMLEARHGLGAGAVDDGIVVVGGGPRVGLSFSTRTEIWQP